MLFRVNDLLSPVAIIVLIGANSGLGADWTQFRGPAQGRYLEGRLPTEWSDTTNVIWKQELPGQGWSSPVVLDGQIYLTAAVELGNSQPAGFGEPSYADVSLRLVRLRKSNGELLGSTEVFMQDGRTAARIHSKNSHASPTPVIDGGQLFVHFGHQGTACLDLQGNIRWKNRQEYEPVHGNGGSPIVVGQTLIFSCDGASRPFVVALDRDTGRELWKRFRETEAVKKFSFSTPLAIDVGGFTQVISPGSNAVCAYDPDDGREIWRAAYDGYSVIPRPVYGQGLVYICTGYDSPRLLAIRVDGRGDVTGTHVQWSIDKAVPHTPSLLMVGDELYMVSDRGIASCVDALSGTVHWRERIGGNFSASPIEAGGLIYLLDEEGTTTVIRASKQFQVVATNSVPQRTLASYAVSEDTIYLRGDSHLYCIRGR